MGNEREWKCRGDLMGAERAYKYSIIKVTESLCTQYVERGKF